MLVSINQETRYKEVDQFGGKIQNKTVDVNRNWTFSQGHSVLSLGISDTCLLSIRFFAPALPTPVKAPGWVLRYVPS